MMTLGQFIEPIYNIADAHDEDKKKAILRIVNTVYRQLSGSLSWEPLRRVKTLDFSAAATDGLWLPADLAGVDYIGDSDDIYHRVDYPSRGDERQRWYYSDINASAALFQKMSIKKGETSFTTTPAIPAKYIGEYVRFGLEVGCYELATVSTIAQRFMGEVVDGEYSQVRPEGTRKISCIDDDGDQISSSVTMYYWQYPVPLFDLSQTIMLPNTRAMELAVEARVTGELDHRTEDAKDLRYMYPKAYEEMVASNPKFISPEVPQNRYGDDSSWGAR